MAKHIHALIDAVSAYPKIRPLDTRSALLGMRIFAPFDTAYGLLRVPAKSSFRRHIHALILCHNNAPTIERAKQSQSRKERAWCEPWRIGSYNNPPLTERVERLSNRKEHSMTIALPGRKIGLGYIGTVIAALLMPPNPNAITAPADLVLNFRVRSLAGLTLFWASFGAVFGWLARRSARQAMSPAALAAS
jgi:hypothetical protein